MSGYEALRALVLDACPEPGDMLSLRRESLVLCGDCGKHMSHDFRCPKCGGPVAAAPVVPSWMWKGGFDACHRSENE